MKKILISILLAFVLFGLAACGGEAENETTTQPTSTAAQVDLSQAINAFNGETGTYSAPEFKNESVTDKINGITELVTREITEATGKNEEKSTASSSTTTTKKETTTPAATTTTEASTQSSHTIKITFKEGQAMTEIFKVLDEKGVASFDDLMNTAQTYDYSYYPLVAAIPSNANRCFKLEGYLFPDTYEFYLNQKPQDAIGKFLRNGKAKITDGMKAQASALGYTMDEVLTVASIVEKEGANANEVAKIAAVIYNRLEEGMKLQMDSSIYYIERHVKPYLTGDINRYNSYYNTYKCSALPAGPISNPGLRTINAALNPADVDYLYFCHDENANYYYAETYEEHQANLKLAGIE